MNVGQDEWNDPHEHHQSGGGKRIIGQNAGHEIPLEKEDVLDKKKKKKKSTGGLLKRLT